MNTGRDTLIGCLCALGCEVLFGFSYLFTKGATETVSTFSLLGWRFLIAVFAFGICASAGLMRIHLRGKKLKPLLTVALLSPVIESIAGTLGIGLTTASESGAFFACIPVVSVLASSLILKLKPTRRQMTGILISLLGVLLTVFAVSSSVSFSVIGYVMLSITVISTSLYSVYVEKAAEYSGAEVTFVMLAVDSFALSTRCCGTTNSISRLDMGTSCC